MAASVSPYFITMHPNIKKSNDENEVSDDRSRGKGGTSNKNKQVVLTRNELTRKRMDLIRTKLEESRARYFEKLQNQTLNCSRPIPRVADVFTQVNNKEQSVREQSMDIVPLTNSGDTSYVYFVVSPDREINSSRVKIRNKERQRDEETRKNIATRSTVTFTSKEDYGIKSERPRTMSIVHSFGIGIPSVPVEPSTRSVGHKQIVFPLPIKYPPRNPPTTPATTLTNSAGHNGRDHDFSDIETIYEKPVKMTICEDNEIVEIRENIGKEVVPHIGSTKSVSTKCLELPFISVDEQRKALGTAGSYGVKSLDFVRKSISQDSSQKRVHFAESVDLPSIKGSQLGVSSEDLTLSDQKPLSAPDLHDGKSRPISDIFHAHSAPETRLLHTSGGRPKKNNKSLDLPKIDIVSTVYDELIVKAIQAYVMTLPPYSKQSHVARQLLDQLQNKTISTSDLNKEQFKMMREDIANLPRNLHNQRGKSQKWATRKGLTEKSYCPLEPKYCRMVLPGALTSGPKIKVLQS